MVSRPGAGTGGLPTPAGFSVIGRWAVERSTGPPAALHDRPWPDPAAATVSILRPDRPALVLGSTQSLAVVDHQGAAEARVQVVRRRSGGGAVLLSPGRVAWVDVFVPAGDPVWSDDVAVAFAWLGDAWSRALRGIGIDARSHSGPMVRGPWSDLVCFAGVGPGEVTVAGRKVVGVSQRRRRQGARFQCAALLSWDPGALLALLDLPAEERHRGHTELAGVAAGLEVDMDRLESAFLAELPGT